MRKILALISCAVIRCNAGVAELSVTINEESGAPVPFNVEPTQVGERLTYVPDLPGVYKVNATYGGLNVPGMWLLKKWTSVFIDKLFNEACFALAVLSKMVVVW